MQKTLFIADLHLPEKSNTITVLLLDWLKTQAQACDALYILGDLFEVWLGDDMQLSTHAPLVQTFKQLTDNGLPIYFIHGNRDFLIGKQFSAATGIQLLPEHIVINLYGQPTLIMHGDTLCTDDHDYQRFRQKVRTPAYRAWAYRQPLWFRRLAAKFYRLRSRLLNRHKSSTIMDVNQTTVVDIMQQYQIKQLIHGHTHRPAIHQWQHANDHYTRSVLAAWESQGNALVCTPEKQFLDYF